MSTTAVQIRTASLDWEDVRHFVALARAGTLSAAARRLGVHHVTVARRVAALERALGAPLLERRAGRHALTPAGEGALQGAAEMERAAATLTGVKAASAARACVRLTSTPSLLDVFLLPRLAPLAALHPELELELLGDTRPLSLARHETDVAVRMGAPRRGEVLGRRIASVAFAFYAAPPVAAAMARGTPVRRIGFEEGSAIPEAAWLASTWPHDRPVYRASSYGSQQLAARTGLGLALLPRFMADPDPALVRVAQPRLPPPRPVWLLRRSSSRADPHVGAVVEFLVALFREHAALFTGARAP